MTRNMRLIISPLAAALVAAACTASTAPLSGSGGWASKAPMPTAREQLAVAVANGVLLSIGGNLDTPQAVVQAYNPSMNTWSARAPMLTPRRGMGIGVVDGIVYAAGGFDGHSNVKTLEAYNPSTNTWTTKAPMPTARTDVAAGVVDGILYVIGGWDGAEYVGTVEAYDPSTNAWTSKAPMLTPRGLLGVGVINGLLYAAGGAGGESAVEVYDPSTNTWTQRAALARGRGGLALGVFTNGLCPGIYCRGSLLAVGGYNSSDSLAGTTVEAYDPLANAWTTEAPLPTARYVLGGAVINGEFYAVGGSNGAVDVDSVEAFTP